MEFEEIFYLKKILALLKQISMEKIFIYGENSSKIHFAAINEERTAIIDILFESDENSFKESNKNFFSIVTNKLFFNLIDTLEKGSTVKLDFNENLEITISYNDIELKSSLNTVTEDFIGFPLSSNKVSYSLSGSTLAHALNLLSKFRNDFEVSAIEKNLVINSKSPYGTSELVIPSEKKSNKNKKDLPKKVIYDYEIIKPLLSMSKLSSEVKIKFEWNDKIEDNILIVIGQFTNYKGRVKYLFTPKEALNGIS